MTPHATLAAADLEVLAFERTPWRYPGAKAEAIRIRFGVTDTRYYQRLNSIIDQPGAVAYDAQLVNRLLRRRAHHRSAR